MIHVVNVQCRENSKEKMKREKGIEEALEEVICTAQIPRSLLQSPLPLPFAAIYSVSLSFLNSEMILPLFSLPQLL